MLPDFDWTTKSYPGKILLFGEHTILKGTQGLAIPTRQFSGAWKFKSNAQKDTRLLDWYEFLLKAQEDQNWIADLDLSAFKEKIEHGLCFESSIPVGYGLGSSGALTAALFDVLGRNKPQDWQRLKQLLGQLESYFHGKSSGIDPLICYLNEPVLLSPTSLRVITLPNPDTSVQLFLLDSQIPRKTGHLVNWFLAQCEDKNYFDRLEAEFIPLVHEAILCLLQGNWIDLFENMHHIGWFQYKYFEPMIPNPIKPFWLDGLSNDWYKLKLCGAGGGGFFLGITNDLPRLQQANPFVLPLPLHS
jgi:mevalonate kinase